MDKETREMFNAVIGEIDKLAEKMNQGFECVGNELKRLNAKIDYVNESLTHEINSCKLDRDIVSILLKKADEHEKRMDSLESKVLYELV